MKDKPLTMSKRPKLIIVVFVLSCTLIGYTLGYYISSTDTSSLTPQEPKTVLQNVPKQKLAITSDFFKVEPMLYNISNEEEYIKTTISLTKEGKEYLSTDLFINEYDVNVYILNNSTEDLYFVISGLEWNINETKNLNIRIDKNQITEEEKLKEFNSQLENINKGIESNILYSVEISPKSNSNNTMRTVGMLKK